MICELLQNAINRHYPELPRDGVKPPLRYSSWIGGDRDGNPFVTVATTRAALLENRLAAVDRLDWRLQEVARLLSVSAYEANVPSDFQSLIDEQLEASGHKAAILARNPTEPFRQLFSAMRNRLAATVGRDEFWPSPSTRSPISLPCSPPAKMPLPP